MDWKYCKKCGSPRIVPVVYGPLRERELAFAWQEKVVPGGCFERSVMPLWGCADCSMEMLDEELGIDERCSAERYRIVMRKLKSEYVPLSDQEYDRIRSLSTLRTISVSLFKGDQNAFAIVAGSPGIDIVTVVDGREVRSDGGYPIESLFARLVACVEGTAEPPLRVRVRVRRTETEAWISMDEARDRDSPRILVRRGDASSINSGTASD